MVANTYTVQLPRHRELFVDGYDASGNRIYDKVNGATCHQCRQKTLGKRTSCAGCKSLQGVFCGDCLFMRWVRMSDSTSPCMASLEHKVLI